ncbi:hypothetical protein [Bradyrhizobium sp. sBnM-33]|uniref:hypothetical protein n=1 Tax=Bradyrhizobium sp. sBnM-33 TaxID=2831780 RepID=UPI001BCC4200|nr:hypothetical protein [Bradyrhizobium sp. sBnM-33]WOH50683.1 hypothetical protein RX328_42910 [Bradyrhizobium sp. sBnM-33]
MNPTVIPNFEDVKTIEDIASRFAMAAKSIMFEHDLRFQSRSWRITALELYLFTESDVWRDPFTHRGDEQLSSRTWYVHHDGRRSPNYSGIDITAGSRQQGIYAGLLIRELDQLDGSARALQTIIRAKFRSTREGNVWTPDEKKILTTIHRSSILSSPLRLIPRSAARSNEPLWCGPRCGLKPKETDDEKFVAAPLRLATWRTKRNQEKMRKFELSEPE